MEYEILYATGLDGWVTKCDLADEVRARIAKGWTPIGSATFQGVFEIDKRKVRFYATQTVTRTPSIFPTE